MTDMFKRISYKIALQFTAFVFLMFLINGALFLAADFGNARRMATARIGQTALFVMDQIRTGPNGGLTVALPPVMRNRVRITDPLGNILYAGDFFEEIPFSSRRGISAVTMEGEQYAILTSPLMQNAQLIGHIQVAEIYRLQLGDLPPRALVYILVSIVVTALTFFVGLFFARRSLKPAEHMVERLEQFTQDASHELRTPIAALSSSLDLALKTEKFKEGIVSAKDDLKQISSIVERLLEIARLDKFIVKTEKVNLSSLIEAEVERHRPLAKEKNITIESIIKQDVMVRAEPSLVRQVLGNLLSNAMKFGKPEGGAVTITLAKNTLTIRDTGIGIAEDVLPHIFDRFYQADSSRANGGYGLGLSLVKRIVELHGWDISVRSKPGQWSAFTVDFSAAV